jgi:hypothetical protein
VNQQRRWPAILKVLIFTLWSLPALCAFSMMWKHWVAVPFWDEWDTPGAQLASYYRGTLNFAELLSQHNEHRLLFPRLVWLPMAILAGWDVRHEMVLTFCFVSLGSAGLYKLLGFSGGSPAGRAFVFGLMNLLLFSPRQYETFLVGAQGLTFVPTVALLFALLVNLSRNSLRMKTIVNATLALVSTYSLGNGMLLWLLVFPLETRSAAADFPASRPRAPIFWGAAYLLIATLAVAGYFISYQHPPLSPPVVSPIEQLPAFVRFVVVWIGSLFSVKAPAFWGAAVLLLFVGLTIAAMRQIRRTGMWRPYYPWFVLACYTIISGGMAAIARLGFHYSMAGDSRYTAFSAFFYIAVVGLGFSVCAQSKAHWLTTRVAFPAAVVSLVVIGAFWTITFKKERHLMQIFTAARQHLLLVLRWSEAIPQNPEIGLLSPYPVREVVNTIRTLAEHDVLRPRLVSQKLTGAVHERPSSDRASAGTLDGAWLEGPGHLVFQGWARVPDQNRPADCVVVGFETSNGAWQPFCVFETGGNRPDVARHFGHAALDRAGFSGRVDATNLPRGDLTLKAWAIDRQNERAFPLAGAIRLLAQP